VTAHPKSESESWEQWRLAAGRADVVSDIRRIYQTFETRIAGYRPVCEQSGRCCRFEQFGHRLFVTGFELAWVLLQNQQRVEPAFDAAPDHQTDVGLVEQDEQDRSLSLDVLSRAESDGACPYQVDGLCSIHTIRPMACRMFFCEQGAEQWMQPLHEQFLEQIKRFHERHELSYSYMEWLTGLRQASQHGIAP